MSRKNLILVVLAVGALATVLIFSGAFKASQNISFKELKLPLSYIVTYKTITAGSNYLVTVYKNGENYREDSTGPDIPKSSYQFGGKSYFCYKEPTKECILSPFKDIPIFSNFSIPARSERFPRNDEAEINRGTVGIISKLPAKKIMNLDARCFRYEGKVSSLFPVETVFCLHPDYDIILEDAQIEAQTLNFDSISSSIFELPKDYKILNNLSERQARP